MKIEIEKHNNKNISINSAFLPVVMTFSLLPNSNRILFRAMQEAAQVLMTKM